MPVRKNSMNNLKPCGHKFTDEDRKKAGKTKHEKKMLYDVLNDWLDGDLTKEQIEKIEKSGLGFSENMNRKMLILLPLLRNIDMGSNKALKMLTEILDNEKSNKRRDLEMEKTKQEIEMLKLQNEKLRQQLGQSGDIEDTEQLEMDVFGNGDN